MGIDCRLPATDTRRWFFFGRKALCKLPQKHEVQLAVDVIPGRRAKIIRKGVVAELAVGGGQGELRPSVGPVFNPKQRNGACV